MLPAVLVIKPTKAIAPLPPQLEKNTIIFPDL
jgi:hypothetical protein